MAAGTGNPTRGSMVGATSPSLPPSRSARRPLAPAMIIGTGLVVWAVSAVPVARSIFSSALPWSAVSTSTPPRARVASAIRPSCVSTTSTAVTVAGKTPVWPTMSALAKLTTMKASVPWAIRSSTAWATPAALIAGWIDDRVGQLASPVGPEIEEDHTIALAHGWRWIGGHRHDAGGNQEFVCDPLAVAVGDEGHGVRRGRPLALDDRPVGSLGSVPAPVAVHGVIATAHRCDAADSDGLHFRRQVRYVAGAAGRRLIPAVGD